MKKFYKVLIKRVCHKNVFWLQEVLRVIMYLSLDIKSDGKTICMHIGENSVLIQPDLMSAQPAENSR